jgi:hypothetical protein
MDIKRYDRYTTHRRIAMTAGLFILLIAGITGAGMLVFSPSANAWPTAGWVSWSPPEGDAGGGTQQAGGLVASEGAEEDENDEAEDESLLARLFSFLKDETPEVDTTALAGAALASAADAALETADTGGTNDEPLTDTADADEGGGEDSEVVFQVTQQEVDQAMAAGEEAVGFWRSLWEMIKGAFVAVANTIVSAVGAD